MSFTKAHLREYIKIKRKSRREYSFKKLGGKCVHCESVDSLQFDHIDPNTKLCTISSLWTSSIEKFNYELSKCQLLCEDCHKIKTKSELPPLKIIHGKAWTYRKYKCRCEPCREAKRQSRIRLKRRRQRAAAVCKIALSGK